MNRLVIIGNGFDIAHGLPTKYSNFMKYLCSYEKEQEVIFDRYVRLDSVSLQDQERHCFYDAISKYIPEQDLWSSFEDALSILDDKQLQDDNFCYLLGYGDENWRDSAHHDFQYMVGEALSFASDIPRYFSKWISGINTHVCSIVPTNIINSNYLFLNFNYTDTLESVYGIPVGHILYIHGKALRGDNLILGHHDDTLFQDEPIPQFQSEEERGIYYEYTEDLRITEAREIIKAYFRGTYKDTTSIIQQNQAFFYSLNSISEVYILGHSLSAIDFEYFLEIKKYVPLTCKWSISYHSGEDYYNAQNFISILGIQNYQLFYF